jgi:hypothetical protein
MPLLTANLYFPPSFFGLIVALCAAPDIVLLGAKETKILLILSSKAF